MLLLWLLIINTLDDIIARNIQGGRNGKLRAPFNAQAFDFSRPPTETLGEGPVNDPTEFDGLRPCQLSIQWKHFLKVAHR